MARVRMRGKPNIMYAISGAVSLALGLLVGNNVLSSVGTSVGNITSTPFYSALSFLGMDDTGGTWSQTAIVGVLGLVAVASFVLSFVKVSFRN